MNVIVRLVDNNMVWYGLPICPVSSSSNKIYVYKSYMLYVSALSRIKEQCVRVCVWLCYTCGEGARPHPKNIRKMNNNKKCTNAIDIPDKILIEAYQRHYDYYYYFYYYYRLCAAFNLDMSSNFIFIVFPHAHALDFCFFFFLLFKATRIIIWLCVAWSRRRVCLYFVSFFVYIFLFKFSRVAFQCSNSTMTLSPNQWQISLSIYIHPWCEYVLILR